MPLFVAVIDQAGRASRTVELSRFPVVLGRAAGADVRVEGPGVWDRHLALELVRSEGLVATTAEGALASLGGLTFERRVLRNGDEVRVGDAGVKVLIAAPDRRSQLFWGVLGGLLVAAVLAIQGLLLWELTQ